MCKTTEIIAKFYTLSPRIPHIRVQIPYAHVLFRGVIEIENFTDLTQVISILYLFYRVNLCKLFRRVKHSLIIHTKTNSANL